MNKQSRIWAKILYTQVCHGAYDVEYGCAPLVSPDEWEEVTWEELALLQKNARKMFAYRDFYPIVVLKTDLDIRQHVAHIREALDKEQKALADRQAKRQAAAKARAKAKYKKLVETARRTLAELEHLPAHSS